MGLLHQSAKNTIQLPITPGLWLSSRLLRSRSRPRHILWQRDVHETSRQQNASACFYHIRRLCHIHHLVSREVLTQLVTSLVLSRLDYCNAILAGLPASTLAPLQHEQRPPVSHSGLIGGHTSLQRSRSYTGCRSSTVSPSKLLLSCIRLSTVDAHRTSLTLSCLLRPTQMYANFVPPRLEPLPSNEAGRSSEGVPSQWPAPTYGTVSPPPSVPSTPTQPSVVCSRHICSGQVCTIWTPTKVYKTNL